MEGVAAEEEGVQVAWGVTSRRLVQIALVSVCVFVCAGVCVCVYENEQENDHDNDSE